MIIAYAVKYGLFDLRKELLPLPAVLAGVITGISFNYTIELARAFSHIHY